MTMNRSQAADLDNKRCKESQACKGCRCEPINKEKMMSTTETKYTLEPLNEWILVEIEDAEAASGELYIPSGGSERAARVVKVGPGAMTPQGVRLKPSVAPGDRVLLVKDRGRKTRWRGVEHLFVTDRDFVARIGD